MTNDLDEKEQKNVRTAIRFLRLRVGGWCALAKVLSFTTGSLDKVIRGYRPVTPTMAFRVARLAGVGVDDLLAGKFTPAGTCAHCGHAPDFTDEGTVVED